MNPLNVGEVLLVNLKDEFGQVPRSPITKEEKNLAKQLLLTIKNFISELQEGLLPLVKVEYDENLDEPFESDPFFEKDEHPYNLRISQQQREICDDSSNEHYEYEEPEPMDGTQSNSNSPQRLDPDYEYSEEKPKLPTCKRRLEETRILKEELLKRYSEVKGQGLKIMHKDLIEWGKQICKENAFHKIKVSSHWVLHWKRENNISLKTPKIPAEETSQSQPSQQSELIQQLIPQELYRTTMKSENNAVDFLRSKGLLPSKDEMTLCTKKSKEGKVCGFVMKATFKNTSPILRCTNYKCSTTRSIRRTSQFFCSVDANGRTGHSLRVHEILQIMWLWVNETGTMETVRLTNKSHSCIRHWLTKFRSVCAALFTKRQQLGGDGKTVLIDECLFQSKRPRNRGKKRKKNATDSDYVEEEIIGTNLPDELNIQKKDRVEGPWVFGLICSLTKERRFFIVDNRDANTLLPIIASEVKPGSTILSDGWRFYSELTSQGYLYQTVNHFIDPATGVETHTFEPLWKHVKERCGINSRGADSFLQAKLDEEWWRSMHSNQSQLFDDFLEAIKQVYPID